MQGRGFEQLAEGTHRPHRRHRSIFQRFRRRQRSAADQPRARPQSRSRSPEIDFYTNDSWAVVRGVAAAKGFPMVLINHYSKGTLYLWTMPDNFGDLYNLPQTDADQVKDYLFADAPVRIDAPAAGRAVHL